MLRRTITLNRTKAVAFDMLSRAKFTITDFAVPWIRTPTSIFRPDDRLSMRLADRSLCLTSKVLACMLGLRRQFGKIRSVVIQRIAINVVNYLFALHWIIGMRIVPYLARTQNVRRVNAVLQPFSGRYPNKYSRRAVLISTKDKSFEKRVIRAYEPATFSVAFSHLSCYFGATHRAFVSLHLSSQPLTTFFSEMVRGLIGTSMAAIFTRRKAQKNVAANWASERLFHEYIIAYGLH